MEIITAIGFVILACAIQPPSWWQIIVYILFIIFAIALGSVTVTNNLMQMREWVKKKKK